MILHILSANTYTHDYKTIFKQSYFHYLLTYVIILHFVIWWSWMIYFETSRVRTDAAELFSKLYIHHAKPQLESFLTSSFNPNISVAQSNPNCNPVLLLWTSILFIPFKVMWSPIISNLTLGGVLSIIYEIISENDKLPV